MSSAYIRSSFIERHTSSILKSFVTYLNIPENSMHCDYTRFSQSARISFEEVPALSNTEPEISNWHIVHVP